MHATLPAFHVRRSPIHGRGVFTTTRIPRRMKLGEVSGELRRLPQARQAMQARAVIHLVELSRRWALDCSRGNHFRHLNHSCQANCYLRIWRRRVEVYSRGAIARDQELTVDYRSTQHPGGMMCGCGRPGCRSLL
ncbi:MAG: SET domain-containing protein [Planctomycetes bacterium]|nr:SET domain-containing protein [Planctomycetota bacterium]